MVKYEEVSRMGEGTIQMNGETVKKGSFFVGMMNGQAFERAAAQNTLSPEVIAKRDEVVTDLDRLPLVNAGAFTFFTPIEWLRGSEGRQIVALVYLRRKPEDITPEVKEHLNAGVRNGSSTLLFRDTVKSVLPTPTWYEG